MKRRIIHLIGVVLLLSLLFAGCNDAVKPTEPDETPVNTPAETPEETPGETPAETPGGTQAPTLDTTPIENPMTMESEHDVSKFPFDVRCAMFYFGNYNGVYVLDISEGTMTGDIYQEEIEGYSFLYWDDMLNVYNANDGKFYTLSEAYESGLLPLEVIRYMHQKHVFIRPRRYHIEGYPVPDEEPVFTVRSDGFYYFEGECTGIKAGVSDNVTERYWAKLDARGHGYLTTTEFESVG